MNAPGILRPLRAAVFSTVTVGLSVLGHGLAAHTPVPTGTVALGFAAVTAAAAALGARERSYGAIVTGMFVGQIGLHLMFSAVAPATHPPGHPFVGVTVPDHVHLVPGGGGVGMVIAHAWAALVAAWWLRRGEMAVWTLVRRLVLAVCVPPGLIRSALPAGDPLVARVFDRNPSPVPRSAVALRHVVSRRGPPLAPRRPDPAR